LSTPICNVIRRAERVDDEPAACAGDDDAAARRLAALDATRRAIRRRGVSIALAVSPFGVAFGVTCAKAGLNIVLAIGFSTLVFTGGSQFAAVGVLLEHGAAFAAITAGLLLGLRFLAYGVVMAPALRGPWWKRALSSQLMIDEAVAVGAAHDDLELRRYGYLCGGVSVFVLWNIATVAGFLLGNASDEWINRLGIDGTIPASFLALVWSRLTDPVQRWVALGGAAISLVAVPIAPSGLPIILAGCAVGVAPFIRRRGRGSDPNHTLPAHRPNASSAGAEGVAT
jgi:predicted branched-subunit amino acid permease